MKKRNLTVLASSALLAACLVSAPAMLNANADGSFFQMVDGATIRTTPENPGIRFSATMSSDVYSSVVAENSGKSFGMLVVPTDYLTGAEDTDGDGVKNYVEYVSANYKKEVGGETVVLGLMEDLTAYSYDVNKDGTNDICISGAVTGMQFKNMNRDFTGIAFIKTVGTEKTTYEYATTLTGEYASRNITYVASAASLDPDNAAFESTLTDFVQAGVKQAAGLAETDAMPEVSATLLNGKTTTSDIEDVKLEAALSVNDQALAIELAYAWASNNETALAIDKTKGYAIPQDVSEAAEAKVTYTVGGLDAYTTDVTVNVFSQYEDVKQYYNMEEENATDGAGVTDFAAQANAKVSVLEGKTLTYGVWSSGEHMTDIEADMNADGKLSTADMIEFRNYALTAYVTTETGRTVGAYVCVAQPFKLSTVISTGFIDFSKKAQTQNPDQGSATRTEIAFTDNGDGSYSTTEYDFNRKNIVKLASLYESGLMQKVYDMGYTTLELPALVTGGSNTWSYTLDIDGQRVNGFNLSSAADRKFVFDVLAFIKYSEMELSSSATAYYAHLWIPSKTANAGKTLVFKTSQLVLATA